MSQQPDERGEHLRGFHRDETYKGERALCLPVGRRSLSSSSIPREVYGDNQDINSHHQLLEE